MPDSEELRPAPRGQSQALGLGERLRSARKARALSVTQVAEALHLEEASVIALEDERFDVMGAAVFVRGHLRRYAQLVGLSPDAVLDAYRAAVPDSMAPPSLARSRAEPDRVRVGSWAYWLAAGVVLLALLFALGGGDDSGEAPAPAEESVSATPGEPAAPAAAPSAPEAPAPPADSGNGAEPAAESTLPRE